MSFFVISNGAIALIFISINSERNPLNNINCNNNIEGIFRLLTRSDTKVRNL